jgi:tRNA threonylcarbamoyladenosine biosynthesis protein TsaE
MNTDMTLEITSSAPEESLRLGERLGRLLKGGMVVELTGDLGAGKTLLVRGIAKGLGVEGEVASPSFTISRVYPIPGGGELHHFDFYRLNDKDIVNRELAEAASDPSSIVAIEWAERAGDVLPEERLVIHLEADGEERRRIRLTAGGDMYKEVLDGMK